MVWDSFVICCLNPTFVVNESIDAGYVIFDLPSYVVTCPIRLEPRDSKDKTNDLAYTPSIISLSFCIVKPYNFLYNYKVSLGIISNSKADNVIKSTAVGFVTTNSTA